MDRMTNYGQDDKLSAEVSDACFCLLYSTSRKDQQTTFTTSPNNNLVILSRRRRILFRLLAKVS
jgi:hypothetical protein